MTTNLATKIESVLVDGNLAQLKPDERIAYYKNVCESLGLNPLTKPFEYITLNNKLTLYARRDATDQLRKLHGVSISIVSREIAGDCYIVTAKAMNAQGRTDEALGAVALPEKGEARANAMMKAETKAKRRVTLSICGLGVMDEAEMEAVSNVGILDRMAARAEHEPGEDVDSQSTSWPSGEDDVPIYVKSKDGEVTISGYEPRRTLEQNAKLHAMLNEGKWNDEDKAKACGRYLKESTKDLSKRECAEMIDRMEKKLQRARTATKELGEAMGREPGGEG